MLKCGSLMWGSSSFKPEKKPLIASMAAFTFSLALSMGVVIAFLMAFHTVVAVSLIPLKMLLIVVLIELNTLLTVVFMPFMTLEIVVEMAFIVLLIKDLMLFHMFVKKFFTPDQTCSQLDPIQPSATSSTPLMVSRMFVNHETSPFQMLLKMFFTASHAPSQSPLKTAIKKSTVFRITSSTVESVSDINLNAPSNTGPSRLQKPSHTAFSTSVMLLNSKPREFSRSTMPWQKLLTVSLICVHVAMMFSRKPSFVFHR